jgi:hypothetical protein
MLSDDWGEGLRNKRGPDMDGNNKSQKFIYRSVLLATLAGLFSSSISS